MLSISNVYAGVGGTIVKSNIQQKLFLPNVSSFRFPTCLGKGVVHALFFSLLLRCRLQGFKVMTYFEVWKHYKLSLKYSKYLTIEFSIFDSILHYRKSLLSGENSGSNFNPHDINPLKKSPEETCPWTFIIPLSPVSHSWAASLNFILSFWNFIFHSPQAASIRKGPRFWVADGRQRCDERGECRTVHSEKCLCRKCSKSFPRYLFLMKLN